MELKDKIILVTGGAHRLGKAMALHVARLGMHVAITYRSSAKPAEETSAEIEALGRQCLALRCDQSQAEEIQLTVEAILARFGRIDVLVNSAANFEQRDFFEVTPAGWDNVLNTNTRGPFFFTQAVARHMLAGEGGAIVNIIDEGAIKPSPDYPDHSVSKGALWNLTRLSAQRLAPKIRVNAILPGAVLQPPDWSNDRYNALVDSILLRKLGSPQDVCYALEYLLHAEYVTGQVMVVDGGRTV